MAVSGFLAETSRSAWKRMRRVSRFSILGATTMKCFATAVCCMVLALPQVCSGGESDQQGEPWDVLIRGGQIVDGTGNPWFVGDVAIRGDRIEKVSRQEPEATARRVIEAEGLIVA